MLRTILILFLLAAMCAEVQAQSYDQLSKWCYGDATDDQTIQGCSAVVASGRVTGTDLASAFYNRGISYNNKGQDDRAIQDYDQAIKLDPNYARAFTNRGNSYDNKGQSDRAIQDYEEATKLSPNSVFTFNSHAIAYLKLNRLDLAISDYDAALKLDPKFAESLFGRGVAKRKKGGLAGGDADIATAKAVKAGIADDMAKLGVQP